MGVGPPKVPPLQEAYCRLDDSREQCLGTRVACGAVCDTNAADSLALRVRLAGRVHATGLVIVLQYGCAYVYN